MIDAFSRHFSRRRSNEQLVKCLRTLFNARFECALAYLLFGFPLALLLQPLLLVLLPLEVAFVERPRHILPIVSAIRTVKFGLESALLELLKLFHQLFFFEKLLVGLSLLDVQSV